MSRIWFITGSSTGFGRTVAEKVLAHGDSVVATARRPEQLADLVAEYPQQCKAIRLDVTQPQEIRAAVAEAVEAFGRIDVLLNNAGYGLLGALEEVSEEQLRANIETNLIGPMQVMRAVLPIMRQQKSGHILNLTAIAGIVNEGGFGVYGAAKFGLEGASEAVRSETTHLGIKVTIIEPGPFRTDFIGRSLERAPQTIADYDPSVGKFGRLLDSISGKQPGDPAKAAEVIIQVVESENPPLRLPLGAYAFRKIRNKINDLSRELDTWEPIAKRTDFPLGK